MTAPPLDPPDRRLSDEDIDYAHIVAELLEDHIAGPLEKLGFDDEARRARALAEDVRKAAGPLPPDPDEDRER